MIRPMHLPERQRRAIRRSLLLCAMVLVALTAVAPETSAQTVRRVWRASIGTAGVNGSATITAFTDGTGWLHVSGRNLHPTGPLNTRKNPMAAKSRWMVRDSVVCDRSVRFPYGFKCRPAPRH